MKKAVLFFLIMALNSAIVMLPGILRAQTYEVKNAVHFDVSKPLREMKPPRVPFWKKWKREVENEVPNKFRQAPPGIVPDGALQKDYNYSKTTGVPLVNFNGITNGSNPGRVTPPDPAGDVGLNHYVQVVNCMLQVFNKSGVSLYGPVTTSTLWSGFSGNWTGHNDGDAVVLYDENADRWLICQFAIDCSGSPYTEYELVAISTTADPTGSYYRYAFQFDYMPDYPKLGVWPDGYYMAVNRFNTNSMSQPFIGVGACVLERSKMLTGDASARMIYFKTETLGGSGSGSGSSCWSMLPSDCDGTFPATGTPNYFAYINGAAELRLWALHVDWTTTSNSTFTYVTSLPVAAYTQLGTSAAVSQQGTTNKLDGLGDRLMFRNQYRNFGSYETFLTCHSVNAGNGVGGMRWYEYRKVGSAFSLYQQSTYAPNDGKSRWMGSIAMNAYGDIGLAYTVSSGTMYPSIYFTGRKSTDPLNQMTIPEGIIQTGTAAINDYTRWGDYSAINVDPADNKTFWTTQEYVGTYGGWAPWATKIAAFALRNNPDVLTQQASSITTTSGTLNGTINPNGLATTYYFEWGATTSYGNSTSTASAGSGTTAVSVNASLSGLTAGTVYHYRLNGVNSDGTTNGNDLILIPGGAVVTTAAVSSIMTTSAVSGGNVTSDGGSSVTARGICWGSSANPAVSGNHTTDGSGTGVFTSNISGLSPNTLYHVRAYATNGYGTYYGDDQQFSTLCTNYSLPFSEGFSGTTIPSCWTQVDHVGYGQIWSFGTLTSQIPNPLLNGNYAYLNSNGFGVGGSQNADLISPPMNLLYYSPIYLQFNHYFKTAAGSSGTLSYTLDNGNTWTVLATFAANSPSNPESYNQSIPGLVGHSGVRFKWNYTGNYGYSWAIDDIQVTGTYVGQTLSVTPSNQNVPASAGTTSFAVSATASWTVSSDKSWCTVTPSGAGIGAITATFTQNTNTAPRTANITVTLGTLAPVVVTVTQAAPTLSVSPSNQNVVWSAGNTTFTVTSNSSWTASSNQAWCTVTSSGTGNSIITAACAPNYTFSQRIAAITVSVNGLSPVTVTVTQDPAPEPEFHFTIVNDVQTSDRTLEFDLYLLDVQSVSALELAIIQAGILVDNGIINGGAISPSIVTGYSDLVTLEQPSVALWSTGESMGCIKVTPKAGPGCGNGTMISTSGPGTRICRVRITNTVPFTPGSHANLDFCFTTQPYPTKVFQYSGAPCMSTQLAANPTNCFSLATNPVLNGPPALSVTPSDQSVSSSSGSIQFTVTSNATWMVSSNQSWCTVTSSGFGNGTITASYNENTSVTPRVAQITITVSGLSPVVVTLSQEGLPLRTFNMTVFLEGLYIGNSTMSPAMDENGYHWGGTIADMISIELHNGTNYSSLVYTVTNIPLYTNGTATFTVPSSLSGNYYVTVIHRNHILTTTANPVSFNGPVINYNFDAPGKAYGGNMLLMVDGKYVFYAGDENQDGIVDGSDLSDTENMARFAASGYLAQDLNGDGLVDGTDLSIAGNNAMLAVESITP